MEIAIAGGGIAGLSVALCLEKVGYEVVIYEKAPVFIEIGAGIQCGANACSVLDYLGVLDAVKAVAVAPQAIEICHNVRGNSLYQVPLGDDYQAEYGYPYLHVHRADLHSVLLLSAQNRQRIHIEQGETVCSYQEENERVYFTLESGKRQCSDILIAADGIHSQLRASMFAKLGLLSLLNSRSRFYAWRGLIDTAQLEPDFMAKKAYNFVGKHKHFVTYYVRQQKYLNFVGVVARKHGAISKPSQRASWVSTGDWQALQDDFSGWHTTVSKIIAQAHPNESYQWPLFEYAPFSKWHTARTVLIGDAAHPTLPFLASGAAMALEDAVILQRCITECSSVEQALKAYYHHRYTRCKKVQSLSRRAGSLYHFPNHSMKTLAYCALQKAPFQMESYLPKYNPVEMRLRRQ